jgi:hypothetical protein
MWASLMYRVGHDQHAVDYIYAQKRVQDINWQYTVAEMVAQTGVPGGRVDVYQDFPAWMSERVLRVERHLSAAKTLTSISQLR